MNFIFISPHFPHTYWEFCHRLKQNGVKVLGIADAPYDSLKKELKESLTEYYRVDSLENYDEVYRAVAYFAFRYGRIDWIESNNEYWLEQDARLRTDFNVTTGIRTDRIRSIKEKSEMKKYYAKGGIPTARQIRASKGFNAVRDFASLTRYPIIAKPDVGVGASGTHKIESDEQLQTFFNKVSDYKNYVVEEFITGEICSYDAIIDAKGNPLFESMTVWPPSIMDIVNLRLDLSYYVDREMPESLRALGRRTVKAFNICNRFVHLEFFRLDSDREGLGTRGDFVALEVNMRPAGGYTPDMINFAHSTDVYKIWADMVAFGESRTQQWRQQYCAFASRRDIYQYVHTHEEVLNRYGDRIVMCERMPDLFSAAMGQQMYTVRLQTMEEVNEFVKFVHEKKL
ncbi:MAG: ATP-grasp domain-containing protein [Prevotella sp.]|nr:ATP-grasp domain-containing protein [Prevotella sp.]MBQ8457877.1 ATP-grasp domain-containing protein [Prevotella sp.]